MSSKEHPRRQTKESGIELDKTIIGIEGCTFSPPYITTPTPPNSANELNEVRDPREIYVRSNVTPLSPEVRKEYVLEQLELHKRERFESIKHKKKQDRTERSQKHRRAEGSSETRENDIGTYRIIYDPKFSVEPAIPEHKRNIVDGESFISPKKVRTSADLSPSSPGKLNERDVTDTLDREGSSSSNSQSKSWKDLFQSTSSWLVISTSVTVVGIVGMLALRHFKKK